MKTLLRTAYKPISTTANDQYITPEWSASFRFFCKSFLENLEARMLQAGLEFFSFCPRPGEIWEVLLLRFNTMLHKADSIAELQISWPFKSWMLLSLLRLPSRKWTELLKEMNHHFPRNEEQYQELQQMILREKTLETDTLHLFFHGWWQT